MISYRDTIEALIDPGQTEALLEGAFVQHVSVVLYDTCPDDAYEPAVACTLRPSEARELAFQLLVLAEHAELAGSSR